MNASPGRNAPIPADPILTLQDRSNALEENLRRGVLEDDASSAQLQGLNDLFCVDARSRDQRAQRGGRTDLAEGREPAYTGHGEVEKKDVRLERSCKPKRVLTILSFPNDLKAGLGLEELPQSGAKQRVIVRDQDADGTLGFRHRFEKL